MSIEAPLSKYKKKTFIIWIVVCLGFTALFLYDGYLSKYKWSMRYSFYEEHVLKKGGKPDDMMVWNQKWLPIICVGGAVLLGAYLFVIGSKKIVADENELIISAKEKIPYDSIEKIDKTHFGSKGYFIITYKDKEGNQTSRKISDKSYDNLAAVLEHLVAKMSS